MEGIHDMWQRALSSGNEACTMSQRHELWEEGERMVALDVCVCVCSTKAYVIVYVVL